MQFDKPNIVTDATVRLVKDCAVLPLTYAEIEFYLTRLDGSTGGEEITETTTAAFIAEATSWCAVNNIPLFRFEEERGNHQIEAILAYSEPLRTADALAQLKLGLPDVAATFSLGVDFSPKPYTDNPGSGIHIHVKLVDREGKNLYAKKINDDNESELMQHSIGGLLATMEAGMVFFAPHDYSYARFSARYNPETETHNNAPTYICWGANNRTTALRIPSSTHDPDSRNLEHRIPGSDADPHLVVAAILNGIHYGLMEKTPAPAKVWGNAFHAEYQRPPYNLKALPATLEEAQAAFEGSLLQRYFTVESGK